MPAWLQVNDIEDLETDLIGISVVVLAVNFPSITFASSINMMEYGIGIAFLIAALALYIYVRGKKSESHQRDLSNQSEKKSRE
jgi:uncharacterized membrane protein YqhA